MRANTGSSFSFEHSHTRNPAQKEDSLAVTMLKQNMIVIYKSVH